MFIKSPLVSQRYHPPLVLHLARLYLIHYALCHTLSFHIIDIENLSRLSTGTSNRSRRHRTVHGTFHKFSMDFPSNKENDGFLKEKSLLLYDLMSI